jgi:peptidyl-prolyl cis-trans isomerase D
MFDMIRQHQRLLMALLVLLIFPAFAFFGISGYDRMFAADDTVAKVGELSISAREFEQARQGQVQRMRQMMGARFDPATFDTPESREQLLEQLVNQRVLAVEAQETNVVVPDVAVRNAINSDPTFFGEDSKFSLERYQQLLAAQGANELLYENQIRSQLALNAIPTAVSATGIVPRSVSRGMVKLNLQKRKFASRVFKTEDFISEAEVDTDKARAFYDENPKLFESREAVKIEYLVLSEKTLSDNAVVTDDERNEYYENNSKQYVQAEQRQARHILINVDADADQAAKDEAKAKAQSILDKIRAGADFAETAKKESQDPGTAENGGDLGFFDRETMVKGFADAAFNLEKGAISDVVESEFGMHIIELTDIREKTQKPLEEVKDEVDAAIKTQKGRQAFLELAETFTNTAYEQPDSMEPLAEKLQMELKTIEKFQRFGTPDLAPNSPLNDPKFVRAVFSTEAIEEKTNIEPVETTPNVLVGARVLEHFPVKLQSFEAVEADAISRVRANRAAELAKEAGEAEIKRLLDGGKPKDLEEAKSVDRYGSGLLPPASKALFSAAPDKFPGFIGIEMGTSGYMVAQLIAIEDADDKAIDEAVAGFGDQASAISGRESFQSFLESIKKRTLIERNLDQITASPNDDY